MGHSALTDRKSTRLNSSHGYISYADFCLKKKSRSGLVQIHPALDQAAGDVGVGAASHRLDEGVDLVAEGALLRVRLRGAAVESDFRDDVLLAETARFHPRYGERIPRLQRAEQVVDDALRLADLLRVGSRGVDQHVHGLGVAALVGAGRCRQSKQRREKQALDHDRPPYAARFTGRDSDESPSERAAFTRRSTSRGSTIVKSYTPISTLQSCRTRLPRTRNRKAVARMSITRNAPPTVRSE